MSIEELREAFLTSGLTDQQRAELVAAADEVPFRSDDILFVEGEPADHFWILLDGSLELSRRSATETIVLATMSTPGQWAGGLRAWGGDGGSAGYRATGRALTPGRCLRLPSEELGRLVGEWFPFGKHLITGIYQTIRAIEATVRQRESLVALGTLAAGLAHEINNPAAAAVRAVEALRTTCDTMLTSLTQLAESSISPEQYVALDALRVEAVAGEAPASGALEVADREEAVGEWLAARSVDHAWQLAAVLAAAGVDAAWCERVRGEVGDEALGPALRWSVSALSANALLDEVHEATTRISELVAAVKSYSQLDRASLQRIDVHDGIESTLVMLSHKLDGIEVERDYGVTPAIDAYAGELNQVWTNLIDNAIDAMHGHGSLRVATRADGPDLVVDIADTGHGMPDAVQARVFEPFFTTKGVGEGTGLGLDIARRIIVERHRGEISFDSSPTGTTAHVRIPMVTAASNDRRYASRR
jgi:signal transduction histidine kinase